MVSGGGAVVDGGVVDVVVDVLASDVVLDDRGDVRTSLDDEPEPHAATPISARLMIQTRGLSTRRCYVDDACSGRGRYFASAAHTPSS